MPRFLVAGTAEHVNMRRMRYGTCNGALRLGTSGYSGTQERSFFQSTSRFALCVKPSNRRLLLTESLLLE